MTAVLFDESCGCIFLNLTTRTSAADPTQSLQKQKYTVCVQTHTITILVMVVFLSKRMAIHHRELHQYHGFFCFSVLSRNARPTLVLSTASDCAARSMSRHMLPFRSPELVHMAGTIVRQSRSLKHWSRTCIRLDIAIQVTISSFVFWICSVAPPVLVTMQEYCSS